VTAPKLAKSRWQRGRLTAFVDAHRLRWDMVMGSLAVIYVVLAFREDTATGAEEGAVWGLAVAFLLEFAARCYDAPKRVDYLRSHWLDLISAIPVPGIPGLRILRLLRLFRVIRVGVLLRHELIARGWQATDLIWPTLVLFWLCSALAMWSVEHDAPGSHVQTFPEAMKAAFLTATTLGFGTRGQPVTSEGQIISGLIVFMALGLWGFASGQLTNLWLEGRHPRKSNDMAGVQQQLHSLHEEMARLSTALGPSEHNAGDPMTTYDPPMTRDGLTPRPRP
jgi:voltage-gated potassium channel